MVLTAPPTRSRPRTVPMDWIKLIIELAALAAMFALLPACSASSMASGVAWAEGPEAAVGRIMPCAEGDAGAARSRAKIRMAAMIVNSEIAAAPSQKNMFRINTFTPLSLAAVPLIVVARPKLSTSPPICMSKLFHENHAHILACLTKSFVWLRRLLSNSRAISRRCSYGNRTFLDRQSIHFRSIMNGDILEARRHREISTGRAKRWRSLIPESLSLTITKGSIISYVPRWNSWEGGLGSLRLNRAMMP